MFHAGDPAREVHFILTGRFSLHVALSTGDESMIGVRGPGDLFGEMALFDADGSRAATVRALEPGTTAAVDRATFESLRAAHPAMTEALLSILADKVRLGDARLLEAIYVPVEVRVLRHLAELADLYAPPGAAAGAPVTVPLRQEDLAALAGGSRATVNRVLRTEAELGIVTIGRSRTVVLDRAALRRRAG